MNDFVYLFPNKLVYIYDSSAMYRKTAEGQLSYLHEFISGWHFNILPAQTTQTFTWNALLDKGKFQTSLIYIIKGLHKSWYPQNATCRLFSYLHSSLSLYNYKSQSSQVPNQSHKILLKLCDIFIFLMQLLSNVFKTNFNEYKGGEEAYKFIQELLHLLF